LRWKNIDEPHKHVYDPMIDPVLQNLSDVEIKAFVESQAWAQGARHASVVLAPRDKIDRLPTDVAWLGRTSQYSPYRNDSLGGIGKNLLRRYKSVERLWDSAKKHAGKNEYTSVVLVRDDSFWTDDIDTKLFHIRRNNTAHSLNCGQWGGHNDKVLVAGGGVADDVLSLYTTWYHDQHQQLHDTFNAEGFLKKIAELRNVPWEEVGSDRLPAVVASHIMMPNVARPALCIARKDSCGYGDSPGQRYPFCEQP